MASIMVDPKPIMRPLNINSNSHLDIQDIDWLMENSLTRNTDIYAIMQGQDSHLHDIIHLNPVQPYDKLHTIYKVYPECRIRLNNERVIMHLLILDRNKSVQRTTNSIAFILETDKYELARQTALARELGIAIEAYYKSIANMFNELKKGEIVDDNEG